MSADNLSAEEGGGGKVILLERGGYKDMDACVMSLIIDIHASEADRTLIGVILGLGMKTQQASELRSPFRLLRSSTTDIRMLYFVISNPRT